jgi:hypothetical protein
VKHRSVVLAVLFNDGRSVFLGFLRCSCSRGQPCALGDPFMVELSRLGDGKNALRYTRPERFVHDSEIQCHWDWRRVVGPGIEKLTVDHDRNGNEPRFARGRNLHQPQSTRSLVDLLAPVLLREPLRVECPRTRSETDESQGGSEREGDGAQPHAI